MLEELFNLIKGNAQESVVNNPDVPNEHNDAVIAEATSTVASGLRNVVAGGGLQSVLSLLKGNNSQDNNSGGILSNPIVSMMVGHFAGKLMNKFNLGGSQANSVASSLIPGVISNLASKTNDPGNSGFSIESLLNSITGGQLNNIAQNQQQGGSGLNISDLLSQFTQQGSNSNQSSGGLMDIVSQLAGGAQAQQQKNGGGGLMDLIQGFMSK